MTRIYEALRKAGESDEVPLDAGVGVIEQPVDSTDFPAESVVTEFPTESHRISAPHVDAPLLRPSSITPAEPVRVPSRSTESVPSINHTRVAPGVVSKSESFDRVAVKYEGKTLLEANVSPQSREQYRRLAATLHHLQTRQGIKVVMVTSALVGEGKTLTASNLALTLSQSYQKQVLLVDADLRRPSLQAVFGIKAERGLSEGLTANDQPRVQVHQVTERLGILPAGRPTSDPIAALTSERMRQLVDEARSTFDWIVLDTPPLALITDANLVAAIADGALIVVKASKTPWDLVDRTVNAIGRERTLGIVLNHATTAVQGYGYYDDYYYYYGARSNDAHS